MQTTRLLSDTIKSTNGPLVIGLIQSGLKLMGSNSTISQKERLTINSFGHPDSYANDMAMYMVRLLLLCNLHLNQSSTTGQVIAVHNAPTNQALTVRLL